nr:probable LRR receptor-like serine/threonine-protein kinase IRK [Tanacetum cinerariifolium]
PTFPDLDNVASTFAPTGTFDKQPSSSPSPFMDEDHYLPVMDDLSFVSWNEDDDSPCKWEGDRCNPRSNRVSDLVLDGFGLSGKWVEVPDSLGKCLSFGTFNVLGNQISRVLPLGVWSLNGLRVLDVLDNLLEGEVPKEIRGLYNLMDIRLRKNQFTGVVPDEIGACAL